MRVPVESDLLLCISPDNHMMHVGPAAEVLPHVELSAGGEAGGSDEALRPPSPHPRPAPLEVYDVTGRQIPPEELPRLAPAGQSARPAPDNVFDDPAKFVPVTRPRTVDQRRLLRRINASLDFVQAYLTEHPEAGSQGGGLPRQTEVPRPRGTYPEVLAALAAELSPLDPNVHTNRGNWFHNLWHAANGTS